MAPMRLPAASRGQNFSPYPKPDSVANVARKSSSSLSASASSKPSGKSASSLIALRKKSQPSSKPPKPTKVSKQEKPVFRGLSMSIAGNIINSAGESVLNEEMIRWFQFHAGSYDREVQSDTTHLICSIEEYKARGPQVKKAWAAQTQTHRVHIVVYDWLEDSLNGPKGHKKKRAEKGYTLDRTIARMKNGKFDHEKFRKRFEDGVRVSKELCDNRLHKIYYDHTGFEYKIVLTRLDKSGEKIRCEKYTLFLFESIAAPHTYMCGAKLSRQYRPNSLYRDKCRPKTFPEAFADFKAFFKSKTEIEWDDRLEGIRKQTAFVYTPPVLGRPIGDVKSGYIRPEWREKEQDVEYDTDSEVEDDDDEETKTSTDGNDSSGDSSAMTMTSKDDSSEATAVESSTSGKEDIIPHFNPQYGFQPDVIDGRLVTDGDIHGPPEILAETASFSDIGGRSDYKEDNMTSSSRSSSNTSFTTGDYAMSPKHENFSAGNAPPSSQKSTVYIDLISD